MAGNTVQLKQENEKKLRRIFLEKPLATKPELAALSGLSVVTVNSLIQDMLRHGEVAENGQIPSDGGRPSMQYAYRFDRNQAAICYAHYDDGKQAIRIHTFVADYSGKKVWEYTQYTDEVRIESFAKALDAAVSENENIRCIYFGIPGVITDGLIAMNDFEALVGEEFLVYYKTRYSVSIYIENDINAISYGHYLSGSYGWKESLVGIYIPKRYCPGAGFVLNGNIYYGAGHMSGEIGKLPVPYDWLKLDYTDSRRVAENVMAVLEILYVTLAPDRFVLYGSFLSGKHIAEIEKKAEAGRNAYPGIFISYRTEIEQDYEAGLTSLALRIIQDV